MKIKYKIIVILTLIMFLFGVLFIFVSLKLQESYEMEKLHKKIENSLQLIKETSKDDLWSIDEKEIDNIFKSFVIDEDIEKIELSNRYVGTREYGSIEKESNSKYQIERKLIIEKNGVTLGELKIVFSSKGLYGRIAIYRNQLIMFIVVLAILVSITVIMALNILLKPIKEIVESILILDHKDYKHRLKINTNDEFKEIASSFNIMVEAIEKEIEAREAQAKSLEKAKDMAENASNAKSQFLANMSHELRTPLNGIIGMSEIISMTELNEEQQQLFRNIVISSESLKNIVNDILDISKIENGKIDLEKRSFRVEEMNETLMESLAVRAHAKHVELIQYVMSDVPDIVIGDDMKIRQILTNVVGNAVKFTEEGHVYLEVKKISEDNENVLLEYLVEDTGIGIESKAQEVIFDPFIQGDLSYTKKYQGTGLGLSIAKRLVDIMGGEVRFHSEEGRGTKFWIRLPLKKSENDIYVPMDMNIDISKMRILVIDDNRLNREIVKRFLEDEGVEVVLVKSGIEGLDVLLDDRNFDVILLDVNMPELDGFDVASEISMRSELKDIHIIMFTSVDVRSQIDRMNMLGVNGYIIKPIKRNELLNKIKETLNLKNKKVIEDSIEEIKKMDENREKKRRILVVEDNPINLAATSIMLGKKGYEVEEAENGAIALKKLKEIEVDLILMDIQMPVMNGYEAMKAIREDEVLKDITIIATTAYAMKEDRDKFMEAGANDYLSKPFGVEELYAILEKYLGR